jgi:Ca2+-binding EF-hand superfamily protein
MSETRQAITNKAFAKFDRDGSGVINASDLRYYHA